MQPWPTSPQLPLLSQRLGPVLVVATSVVMDTLVAVALIAVPTTALTLLALTTLALTELACDAVAPPDPPEPPPGSPSKTTLPPQAKKNATGTRTKEAVERRIRIGSSPI